MLTSISPPPFSPSLISLKDSVDVKNHVYLLKLLLTSRAYLCRGVGWGVEGKQVGSTNEEPQVRGCYNITFICTPINQETVSVLEKTQAKNTFRT